MVDGEAILPGGAVMWTLIPTSVLFGIAVLLVFRRVSPPERIRQTRRRIAGHLYELRLFTDEPAIVWKAQLALLRYNLLYLGLSIVPVLVMAVPGLLLFVQLDALYGLAPLPVGRPAIVTAHLRHLPDPSSPPPVLRPPEGMVLETPGVRVAAEREISWRVRPLRGVNGALRIEFPGMTVEKHIQAGPGPHYLSRRRVHGGWYLLWHPTESPLSVPGVDWIEVRYPHSSVSWLGLDFSWVVWFLLFSGVTVLLLKRRFRVTF
jgi:hypothetical protein